MTAHAIHAALAAQAKPACRVVLVLTVEDFDARDLMLLKTSDVEAHRRVGWEVARQLEKLFCVFCAEEAVHTLSCSDMRGICNKCKDETPRCRKCREYLTAPGDERGRCVTCAQRYRSG